MTYYYYFDFVSLFNDLKDKIFHSKWKWACIPFRFIFFSTLLRSIFHCLSGSGSWGQQFQKRSPDTLLHFHQLHWEDPKAFPSQPKQIISPACPQSVPGKPEPSLCTLLVSWGLTGACPNEHRVKPWNAPYATFNTPNAKSC